MFSLCNNSPSSRFLTQEAGFYKAFAEKWKIYHNFLESTATNMISDFDKLKDILDKAVTAYLNEIEHKFFRKEGRKRAQILKSKISNANNISTLISALEEVIKKGNEDYDSLKTFLFKSINLNFCNNEIKKVYPFSKLSYTEFLEGIIKQVKKQFAEPIFLKTFSDSSGIDNDSEGGLQLK